MASSNDTASDYAQRLKAFLPDPSSTSLSDVEKIREQIHADPELSHLEHSTAALIASYLESLPDNPYKVTRNIGGTGVAAVFQNAGSSSGTGTSTGTDAPHPIVLLRADMDALPIAEQTSVPYASTKTQHDPATNQTHPVMHACGHDMHVAALLGAASHFSTHRTHWRGTLVLIFQPAEERGDGARGMVADGLYTTHGIPVPDIVLGQHVTWERVGNVSVRNGRAMAAADSFKITFHGRGGHGSMPSQGLDPIVMAASAVGRLQTIVSREVDTGEDGDEGLAVVTVGSFQAGMTENVIPHEAVIKVNVRSGCERVRKRVLGSMRRIVKAEADASGAEKEPTVEEISRFPVTRNDEGIVERLRKAFGEVYTTRGEQKPFGPDTTDLSLVSFNPQAAAVNASEDFSVLATGAPDGRDPVPHAFWFWGGVDAEEYDELKKADKPVPGNHSPWFKVATQPTLRVGVSNLLVAGFSFLGAPE